MKFLQRLQWFLTGAAIAFAVPWAIAQTPTIFSSIRVNTTSDLRGAISNGTGNVQVSDSLDVDGQDVDFDLSGFLNVVTDGNIVLDAAGNLSNFVTNGDYNVTTMAVSRFNIDSLGQIDLLPGMAQEVTVTGDLTVTGTCTGCGGASFPLLAPDGTSAAPSYSFTNDTDAGMWLGGVGDLRIGASAAGNATIALNVGQMSIGPNIQANGTTNTFEGTTFNVNPSGGSLPGELQITSDLVAVNGVLRNSNGQVTIPSYSFTANTDTGMYYQPAGTTLRLVADSADVFLASSTAIQIASQLTQSITANGKIITQPTDTDRAYLNLPHGTAPTVPVNGDLWTTTAGLFARINGATVGPYSAGGSPGGADTQVQYNDGGAFGGEAGFTFIEGSDLVSANGTSAPGFQVNETDGSADSKITQIVEDADTFLIRSRTDVGGAGTSLLSAAKSGTDWGAVNWISNNSINFDISGGTDELQISNGFLTGGSGTIFLTGGTGTFRAGTDGSAGDPRYTFTNDQDSGLYLAASNTIGISVNSAAGMLVSDTAITGTSGADMTPARGTFTATFDDACTTSETQDFDWSRQGNIVYIKAVTDGVLCTGDSTNYRTTGAPVPSSIRPSGETAFAVIGGTFVDNSSGVTNGACIAITTAGNIEYRTNANSGCGGGWTAGGNRDSNDDGNGITYMLGNP